ncbi:hypothetical protein [Psychromarinibacter sp. S121]|uniref:hypothetical protein n=1 Tax=Psychromarinibacter sp. S121 TaxID=3415127 RepID=UPI003C7DF250
MKRALLALTVVSMLGACAQQPNQVQAIPVSTMNYSGMTCHQLAAERADIISRVNTLSAAQKQKADQDAVAMGIGMILFWPALFALTAGTDQGPALGQAKGEFDAIEKKLRERGCVRA